jgi:hypothetical protein
MTTDTPICLSPDEVSQLTGKRRYAAQLRALRYMGIDHKQRPDGSVVVLRALLGVPSLSRGAAKRTSPNWD